MMNRNRVIFLGPLPPPVHGFSLANQRMVQLLSLAATVIKIDVRPRGLRFGSIFARSVRTLMAPYFVFIHLLCCLRPSVTSFYVGLSGGRGQFFDAIFLLIAKALGKNVFIHHHSYAYLNHSPLYTKLLLSNLGGSTHIVLCKDMGELLAKKYCIPQQNVRVLSNAAFMPSSLDRDDVPGESSQVLRIGFLSNISEEKGIFDYFKVLQLLSANRIACQGLVAGPVLSRDNDRFKKALSMTSNCEYIGPVYKDRKIDFLNSIDVLVFPTKYANEAEPLILWEAMQAGVVCIATGRGCIPSALDSDSQVCGQDEFDIGKCVDFIAKLAHDRDFLSTEKTKSLQRYIATKLASERALAELIVEISGGQQ